MWARGRSRGADWLFTGKGADPPHQNSVGYWWRKVRTDAGVPTLKLLDLRHFYARA